jgi:hypothetical protein
MVDGGRDRSRRCARVCRQAVGETENNAFDGPVDVSQHADLANATFILTPLWLVTFVGLAVGGDRCRMKTPRPRMTLGR